MIFQRQQQTIFINLTDTFDNICFFMFYYLSSLAEVNFLKIVASEYSHSQTVNLNFSNISKVLKSL